MDSFAALATLESRMTHLAGLERDQLLLLPEAVDDYVGSDNPVRFIDAFVDGLDLTAAGLLRVEAKAMGPAGYAPGDLLKLYIYGYLNRVRSSRRLETECCHRNIEVLLAVADFETGLQDHRRFPARQPRGVSAPCSASSYCCADASTCTAASCWRSTEPASRRSTTRIATSPALRCESSSAAPTSGWKIYLKRLDEGDVEDGATGGGARTKNLAEKIAALNEKSAAVTKLMLAQLERTGEDQIFADRSWTKPRAMAAHTKVGVGYNVQVAVDAKNKLIVEQAVTNQVVDMGLLTETSEPAREILGVETSIDVVADRGYFKIEDIEACEQAGCVPHVAAAARLVGARGPVSQGRVPIRRRARRLRLRPAGKLLTPIRRGRMRDLERTDYGNPKACRACQLRPRCTQERRPLRFSASKTKTFSIAWPSASKRGRRSRPPPRGRRAPVRQHQAVDVSGRIPDARPRQRARRVQPDRARL